MNKLNLTQRTAVALAFAGLSLIGSTAKANTISIGDAVVTGGGPYTWTYTGETLNSYLDTSARVVIFDFRGYNGSNSSSSVNWVFDCYCLVPTPGVPLGAPDALSIGNLVWKWVGGAGSVANSTTYTFSADSSIGTKMPGNYGTLDRGSTVAGNPPSVGAGPTSVPIPDGGLTVALLGFALVGVEGLRRKLSK